MIDNEESPCSICSKPVTNAHKALECGACMMWAHIRCNKLVKKDYDYHDNNPDAPFTCLKCLEDHIPFSKLDHNQFNLCQKYGVNYIIDEHKINHAPRVRDQKLFIEVNKAVFNSITYMYPNSDTCTKFRTLHCHFKCQLWLFMPWYHAKWHFESWRGTFFDISAHKGHSWSIFGFIWGWFGSERKMEKF